MTASHWHGGIRSQWRWWAHPEVHDDPFGGHESLTASYEQRVDSLAAEKETRPHILFTAPDESHTGLGATKDGGDDWPPARRPQHLPGSRRRSQTQGSQHLRAAPSLYLQTTEGVSASDEEQTARTQKRKGLKSSKLHTADTMALKGITWPHKVAYTIDGQPAIYEEMSSVLIING